jgi:hypothetical protein
MTTPSKAGEFSFKSTGVTAAETEGGGGASHVNLEGTATGFGTVIGTLSFFGDAPGAKSGRTRWVGSAYLDNGDMVQGAGDGFFVESGKHKWRVRGIMRVSDGTVMLSDGIVSLDGRTYQGTIYKFD